MPYSVIGTGNYVRAKYYIFTSGQANPSQGNSVPCMRLRVSNRFAVNSMLEVFNHLNSDPQIQPWSQELRPSADPTSPSLYRVDMDPVDVPYLAANPATEGILRAFEAFSTDPQDNGHHRHDRERDRHLPGQRAAGVRAREGVRSRRASDAGNLSILRARLAAGQVQRAGAARRASSRWWTSRSSRPTRRGRAA